VAAVRSTVGGVLATATATAALVACSSPQDREPAVAELQAGSYSEQAEQQHQVNQRYNSLPPRPAGEVAAEGARASLTAPAALAFGARSSTTVRSSPTTEAGAFARLCAGEIDLVDSTRPVTDRERETCDANGLGMVKLRIASDAVVLAASPETGWAGDCLTTSQADQILTDAATTTWSQLGFDDVPLEVGGPATASRTVAGLRADHRVFASAAETRDWVAGSAADRLLAGEVDALATRRARAGAKLLAARRAVDTAADREKAIRARDRIQRVFDVARARYLAALDARGVIDGTRGNVALLSYADSATLPDLEPFAIGADASAADCSLPNPMTIADGGYPLAQPLLLTTTTRSLDRPEVREFLGFYLTASTGLAADASLIPVSRELLDEQLSWLSGDPPVTQPEDEVEPPSPTPHEPVQEQPAM
jgi:ABC-type phosphate transport system substrate-binding protein